MRITAPQIYRSGPANTNSLIACRSFNGDAKVEAGALQVDGDLSLSGAVRVSAGAYLSGTGIVNNVSIAEGGGLRVPSRQTGVLRVGGNLAVGSGLRVDVILADGADVRNVRAKVLEVTGEIVGVQALAAASAFVDGVSVPNIRLRLDGNKVSLRYMRGTTVVLR